MLCLFVAVVVARTFSILIDTSKGFSNYRHMSNIQAFCHILQEAGFPDSQILPVFWEDPLEDPRNLMPGKCYFNDAESIIHHKMKAEQITEQFILNILRLRHSMLKDLDENDNLMVYMCGHGRDNFLKVCNRCFIFKNDLMDAIWYISRRVGRAMLILDTCQASSLIDHDSIPPNITVIATSLEDEFSYSSSVVSSLGVFGIDDFAYAMYKIRPMLEVSVEEYFGHIAPVLESTLKLWGDTKVKMEEFFSSKDGDRKLKDFVL